jgi:hypothetical protein
MKMIRRFIFVPFLLFMLALQPAFLTGCQLKPGCIPGGGQDTPTPDACTVDFVGPEGKTNVTLWYVFEEPYVMQTLADQYQALHPKVTITTIHKDTYDVYLADLAKYGGSTEAPDIYMIRHDALPQSYFKLQPMPKSVLRQGADTPSEPNNYEKSMDEYVNLFTPALRTDMVRDIPSTESYARNCDGTTRTQGLYGIPLSFGGTALLVNNDLVNQHNNAVATQKIDYLTPNPDTDKILSWDQVYKAARTFIKSDTNWLKAPDEEAGSQKWFDENNVSIYGIALGNGKNVQLSSDILTTMMLQYDVPIVSEDHQRVLIGEGQYNTAATNALDRYLDFTLYWDPDWSPSLQAFVDEKVVLAFARNYQMMNIQSQVHFSFSTLFFPQQFPDDQTQWVTPAYYWVEVVNRSSKYPDVAWDFLKFAASHDQALTYATSTVSPPARLDVVDDMTLDALYQPYIQSVPYAQSYYKGDADKIDTAINNAIEQAILSNDPQNTLKALAPQMQQILDANK